MSDKHTLIIEEYGLLAANALPNMSPVVLRAIAKGSIDANEVMDGCEKWITWRLAQAQTELDQWNERAVSSSDVRTKLTDPEPQWIERWKSL